MMKNLISETIKFELINSLIYEGRVEDAKAKYPQDSSVVDYFVNQDPSGNNKYLGWEMKIYKQLPEGVPEELRTRHKEEIARLVSGFHQHSKGLQMRDINQYKSLAELHNAVNPLIKGHEEKEAQKLEEKEGVKKYYEDTDWLLVRPLTYGASCKYGANTKWCVASRDTDEHFESYTDSGLLIYLIHKKSNHKFAFYVDGSNFDYDNKNVYIEIYNPLDSDIAEGEMSVKDFINGLVDGEMANYLDVDYEGFGDDYDDDDYEEEEEWEVYKLNPDGSRGQMIDTAYDYDEIVYIIFDYVWDSYFARGGTRNTIGKYVEFLEKVGLHVELGKVKRGQPIPYLVTDIEEGDEYHRGTNFRSDIANRRLKGVYNDFLTDNYHDVHDTTEFATKLGFPVTVISSDEEREERTKEKEVLKTDLSNVMSKEQGDKLINIIDSIFSSYKSEYDKRMEESLKDVPINFTMNADDETKVLRCLNTESSVGKYTESYLKNQEGNTKTHTFLNYCFYDLTNHRRGLTGIMIREPRGRRDTPLTSWYTKWRNQHKGIYIDFDKWALALLNKKYKQQ